MHVPISASFFFPEEPAPRLLAHDAYGQNRNMVCLLGFRRKYCGRGRTGSKVHGYKTDGAKMDFSFLFGISGYLHKVAKLWGLYRLGNKILGGLCPQDPPKAPKRSKTSATLWAPYGGKTASAKRKGKSGFAPSSIHSPLNSGG